MRGTDAWNDGIDVLQFLIAFEDAWAHRGDVHVAFEIIDDLDLMALFPSGFDEAAGGVEFRITGEDGDFHDGWQFQ